MSNSLWPPRTIAHQAPLSLGSLARILESEKKSEVTQSCLTLCDPMDCSLPGFSIHGIFQARVLELAAIFLSRWSSWPRDWTHVYLHCSQRLYRLNQEYWSGFQFLPPGIEPMSAEFPAWQAGSLPLTTWEGQWVARDRLIGWHYLGNKLIHHLK